LEIGGENKYKIIGFNISSGLFTEVRSEGVESAKRDFNFLQGILNLAVNKLYGGKKNVIATFGLRNENTKRSEGNSVTDIDFSSRIIDAGLDIETLPKLDILLGYKNVNSSGKEFYAIRDTYNRIIDFQAISGRQTENLQAFGFRYRYNPLVFITG
jgi:hypothetical protein